MFGIFHTSVGESVSAGTQNEMPLAIGCSLILGICIFIYVYVKKDAWELSGCKEMKAAIYCMLFGGMAIFLASDLCKWDNLIYVNRQIAKFAGMVQFPWRYLGIATALLTAMTIFIMQIVENHISVNIYNRLMIVIIAMTVLTEGHFMMEFVNIQTEARIYSESDIGTMVVMGAEYLLQGSDKEACKQRNLLTGEGIENTEFHYEKNGKYYLTCINSRDDESYVDVPVWSYNNYHAYKSDGEELLIETGENNRIRIHIPRNFEGTICLKYKVPISWRICEIISCAMLCMIIILKLKYLIKFLIRQRLEEK